MPCELVDDQVKGFPGLTLFSATDTGCMTPTGVYLPRNPSGPSNALNVVLWLHGYYVSDIQALFHSDGTRLRQQVLGSNKDVVLIAPFLGYRHCKKADCTADENGQVFEGPFGVGGLGTGDGLGQYLDLVLGALARRLKPSAPPTLDIKNLVIACHSAGGSAMRLVVDHLGRHQQKLRECWGFDCLNGMGDKKKGIDDDATFWADWMSGPNARPLDIFYGPSTIYQSVKLDLIGQGKATREGNKADPPGPRVRDLHVTIAHPPWWPRAAQNISDYIASVVDAGMAGRGAGGRSGKKAADGEYISPAVEYVNKRYTFPRDVTPNIHYWIATTYFLSQLGGAAFF
jgi:hypothetical protein